VAVDIEQAARLAAFEWLREWMAEHGEVVPRTVLAAGFEFRGVRIPLIAPQGIFTPRGWTMPVSITTVAGGPYPDHFDRTTNLIQYAYRGTDPNHRDNVGLRRARASGTPLIYLHGIEPGQYMPIVPVLIVGDDPARLMFSVAADDYALVVDRVGSGRGVAEEGDIRRAYITRSVRVRLHQQVFRERVIRAYRQACALCRLRHDALLDAAHITPDSDPEGEPTVSNGLALCKLHHAAFDSYFFAVRPDFRIEVRASILAEHDGPMLVVGLQQIHDQRIVLPTHRAQYPDRDRLAARYEAFRRAS
jgi:putative restriction endonuclease